MDFIEQWFGISPDGGSGALEAVYVGVLAIVVAGLVFRRRVRRMIGRADEDRLRR